MFHRIGVFACPGGGKSTFGLSYPGVEQHVWGSSEQDTSEAFSDKSHILKPIKMQWFDCLTDDERKLYLSEPVAGKELEHESTVAILKKKATARNVAKYRRFLNQRKEAYRRGDKGLPETMFMDNGTPFSQDFADYVELVYGAEFETKQGNFDSIGFYRKYAKELMNFFEDFMDFPCHTVMAFHINMSVDQETATRVNFMEDSKKGIKHPKEWMPMVTGQAKYNLAGLFTWAFYLWTEESPGQRNKYLAKLEADTSNVGIAKARIQPFDKPSRIEIPQFKAYQFIEEAIQRKQGGK